MSPMKRYAVLFVPLDENSKQVNQTFSGLTIAYAQIVTAELNDNHTAVCTMCSFYNKQEGIAAPS